MNKDSQAILILCSNLCVGDDILPLKPSEWKKIAKLLLKKQLKPGDLLDMNEDDLTSVLEYDTASIKRIVDLIGRSASLFFEISKYENIGISLITRADVEYPQRIRNKMGESCPPFFFYAGDLSLLKKRGIGFVGSRSMNDDDVEFEKKLVSDAVLNKYAIVSGGARGADTVSEEVALESGGRMIEFLADSMINKMCKSKMIKAIQQGNLLLLSVVNPDMHFNVGNAMNRNKYIYMQSDAVIAVKSTNKGGTWSGAMENIRKKYCPVYCWNNASYEDNTELINNGAIPINDEWRINKISSDENLNNNTNNKIINDDSETDDDIKQLSLFS